MENDLYAADYLELFNNHQKDKQIKEGFVHIQAKDKTYYCFKEFTLDHTNLFQDITTYSVKSSFEKEFEQYIQYFYTKSLNLTPFNGIQFYLISQELKDPKTEEICKNYLKYIDVYSKSFLSFSLCLNSNDDLLNNILKDFCQNIGTIFYNKLHLNWEINQFINILKIPDLDIIEENIILAINSWIKFDYKNRKNLKEKFSDCIQWKYINFETISKEIREFLPCIQFFNDNQIKRSSTQDTCYSLGSNKENWFVYDRNKKKLINIYDCEDEWNNYGKRFKETIYSSNKIPTIFSESREIQTITHTASREIYWEKLQNKKLNIFGEMNSFDEKKIYLLDSTILPFFGGMIEKFLNSSFSEGKNKIIKSESIVFEKMIKCMYTGSFEIQCKDMKEMLELYDKYRFTFRSVFKNEYLLKGSGIDQFWALLKVLNELQSSYHFEIMRMEILKHCDNFNFEHFESIDFQTFYLLKPNDKHYFNYLKIVYKWISINVKNRYNFFPQCINLINFDILLKDLPINELIIANETIPSKELCQLLQKNENLKELIQKSCLNKLK